MVMLFVFFGAWSFLASFVGHLTSPMQLSDALIAAVGLRCELWMQGDFAFFKQPKLRPSTLAHGYTDYLCFACNNQLDFMGVLFVFSRVVAPLLFLGLSTGLSPTSTTPMLFSTAPSIFSRAFLPGSRNTPLFSRMTSILRTMRQPCDSL